MVHERRKGRPAARATGRNPSKSSAERIATALGIVGQRGWVSAAELASAMGVDRSTGWRLARSLERSSRREEADAARRLADALGAPA